MKPTVIDLFAGAGGLSLGFEQSGFNVLLANEYDASIAASYKTNHPHTKMLVADIKDLPIAETFSVYRGKVDVIVGGPPCQGFSQKGQRKTIKDERNYLFKYFVAVVEYLRPQYFIMENVPNLLTAENGYFQREVKDLFQAMGYALTSNTLNAADYGVPQNRRRAVIIGKLGENSLEMPEHKEKPVTIWEAISDLAYHNSGEGSDNDRYRNQPQSKYQRRLRFRSKRLYNHKATRHSELALERLKMIPPNSGKEVLPPEHLTKSIYSGTWTRMGKDEISVTLTTRFDTPSSGKFTHPFLHRAITVREAARIQSFPDTYKFVGTKCSQMKQVGNAVPPLLAKAIATVIMNDIQGEKTI
jgi:DNA (cytosine-5)-methyltransferase 1